MDETGALLGMDHESAYQVRLDELPPLPPPDRKRQRAEQSGGMALVLSIVAANVVVMHGFALPVGHISDFWWWTFFGLNLTEVLVALACFAGVLIGDAGVIRRSAASCFPLPEPVATRLRAGQPLDGQLQNIEDDEHGTYCVRCLVWRPPPVMSGGFPFSVRRQKQAHHCSVCNRCVGEFDHHCGVLGRCIAGSGCRGNMVYFIGLICVGWLGGMTTFAASAMGETRPALPGQPASRAATPPHLPDRLPMPVHHPRWQR